jgi:hypothetical protein
MHQHLTPGNMPAKPYRFVRVSSNRKTGPIPVSSTAAQSCPTACPMRTDSEGGCYAASGNSAIHWRALSEGRAATALDLQGFTDAIRALPKGQLWRMNEAGDLPTTDGRSIDAYRFATIVDANKGRRGFTYTHHDPMAHSTAERVSLPGTGRLSNAALIDAANVRGLTVNLSANNPTHADALASLGIGAPVVTLMDPSAWQGRNISRTPAGRPIVRCPAEHIDGMTCAQCELCANRDRASIVGFTAHGSSKRRVIGIVQAGSVTRKNDHGVNLSV